MEQQQRRPTERFPLIECLVASTRKKKNRRNVSAQQLEELEKQEKKLVDMAKNATIMEVATQTFPCMADNCLCGDRKCSCFLVVSTLAIWAKQTPAEKWFLEEVLETYNKAIFEDRLEDWLAEQTGRLVTRAKLLKTNYLRALGNEVMAEIATAMVGVCKAKKDASIGHMYLDAFARDNNCKGKGKGFGRRSDSLTQFTILDLQEMPDESRTQLRKDVVFFGENGQIVLFRKIIPLNDHLYLGKSPKFMYCEPFEKIVAVTTVGDYLAQMTGILDIARLDATFLALLKGETRPGAPAMQLPIKLQEDDLNQKQLEALQMCLSSTMSVVHGPPGTGKTEVMASVAAQSNPFVVKLMVGPTNRSVEAFVTKCLQKNLSILVLGCDEQLTGNSREHSIGKKRAEDERFQYVDAAYKDGHWDYRRFKDELHQLTIELIAEHDVVCGTIKAVCNSFWTNQPYHVLVDEAGCVVEEWMPSLLTLTNRQKVYVEALSFFGDAKQLTPYTVLADMNVDSVLARLSRMPGIPSVNLEVQYRMPLMVQQLVSKRFYNGTLRYGKKELVQGTVEIHKHTHAAHKALDSYSMYNEKEVDIISSILAPLKGANMEICVIALYKAQLEILSKLFANYKNVVISTVDSVQGLEFSMVIVSLVNDDIDNLFVSNANRINVAISRCKESLIVVGHEKHFGSDGAWSFMEEEDNSADVNELEKDTEDEDEENVVVDNAFWQPIYGERGDWADLTDE